MRTTGSEAGPFPSALVANIVIDTLLLEDRQDESGLIFSVWVQISSIQADACIVTVPQITSDADPR